MKDKMKRTKWIAIKVAEQILREMMDMYPTIAEKTNEPYHVVFSWAERIESILDDGFEDELDGLKKNTLASADKKDELNKEVPPKKRKYKKRRKKNAGKR